MDLPRFRTSLLRWFARGKRPLPWRRNRDAYAIWVSEAMLQQTTVTTVIPYYERFMKRFPTVAALAAAEEDDVVALWSGLGYYSRARNLRHAARQIVKDHGGEFPAEVEAATTLKGVGRYTASAVTSIAYGAREAVVDGNVRRVLSRLHAVRHLSDGDALELASQLLSERAPGAWNEAMMELGALICRPRKPDCLRCPVSAHCLGRDRPEHWSETKPRRETVSTRVEMALVWSHGRILLERNRAGDLMGGLFDLPHTGLPRPAGASESLRERFHGVIQLDEEPTATLRHAVTHHRIQAFIFRGTLARGKPPMGATFHTIEEVLALPVGGLTLKALRAVGVLPKSVQAGPQGGIPPSTRRTRRPSSRPPR